jgi:hypothetical protein
MNIRLSNKVKTFAGAGSFWHKNLEETYHVPFARALSRLSVGSSFYGQFNETAAAITGTRETIVENLVWTFQEPQVLAINADLNRRIVTKAKDYLNGKILVAIARPKTPDFSNYIPLFLNQDPEALKAILTELGEFILWPTQQAVEDEQVMTFEEQKIHYVLPIPHGYVPVCLTTESRELVLGLNYEAKDGFLVFYESPLQLFPQRNFLVRAAWKKIKHLHDYVWGVDNI